MVLHINALLRIQRKGNFSFGKFYKFRAEFCENEQIHVIAWVHLFYSTVSISLNPRLVCMNSLCCKAHLHSYYTSTSKWKLVLYPTTTQIFHTFFFFTRMLILFLTFEPVIRNAPDFLTTGRWLYFCGYLNTVFPLLNWFHYQLYPPLLDCFHHNLQGERRVALPLLLSLLHF